MICKLIHLTLINIHNNILTLNSVASHQRLCERSWVQFPQRPILLPFFCSLQMLIWSRIGCGSSFWSWSRPERNMSIWYVMFTLAHQDDDTALIQLTHTRTSNGKSYDCPGKHLQGVGAGECGKWCGSMNFDRTLDSRRRGWSWCMQRHFIWRILYQSLSTPGSFFTFFYSVTMLRKRVDASDALVPSPSCADRVISVQPKTHLR
jgi:hypothetical protein